MKAIAATVLAGLTVLAIHTRAAHAQQPPPDASQYPPGYAPPPGYTPPPAPSYPAPPGYAQQPAQPAYGQPAYGQPAPQPSYVPPPYSRPAYYPPPPPPPVQRMSMDRSFQIGASLGVGMLRFDDDLGEYKDLAVGYEFRVGFGLAPRLQLLLGVHGATSSEDGFYYDQKVYYAGVQAFLARQFFLRAGLGVANGVVDDAVVLWKGTVGLGVMGAAGIELVQGYNWSLEVAGTVTAGLYDNEQWVTSGVNFGLNFF